MSKQTKSPKTPTAPPPLPEQIKVAEQLIISIAADAEISERLPTLAARCKTLLFTSGPACSSMEEWQRIFEANGFRFVRDTGDPTIRTQLYQSIQHE